MHHLLHHHDMKTNLVIPGGIQTFLGYFYEIFENKV